jgi:predicted TIM-barrel fold metal-dependent hydrolase
MESKDRVNFPPDPNPNPLKFKPPAGACDVHFHIFGPPHVFPFVESRRYTPPAAPLEHYIAVMDYLGIERGVMVHPSVHGDDLAVTYDTLRRAPDRFRGMIRANPRMSADDYAALERIGVRGLRVNFIEEHGGIFDAAEFQAISTQAARANWCVCVHADGNTLAEHADALRACPAPVLIDHMGRVDGRRGINQPEFQTILQLMDEPHMWIKISGADRMMSRGSTFEQVVPFAHALVARAPDRVVWGTDWPHSMVFKPNAMPNDGDLVNMLLELVPDGAQRIRVLVDNPAKLFRF